MTQIGDDRVDCGGANGATSPASQGKALGVASHEEDRVTGDILKQLLASAGLVLLMTIIHGLGLIAISRLLRLRKDRLERHDLDFRAFLLMGVVGLSVFALHTFEIWVFALFYLAVGAITSIEEALYFSASAYATLGRTVDFFPVGWRLVGALEALVGFVLIGWSTAFMVTNMDQLRRRGEG
jgi:hypothetical protein